MKSINEITGQLQQKLPELLPQSLVQIDEISIYKGELSSQCIIRCVSDIKKSFPTLPVGFYDVFADRLKANNFTDQRLQDAVNFVIDTCVYPTPTIAQFIGFDKKIKLYTYQDMVTKVEEFGAEIWNSFKPVKIEDREKPVWVHVDDIKKYNLKTV